MGVIQRVKGWFGIPGIRPHGDRTIEEQMLGLERALAEAKGKTVLDLGCAEGVITKAFADAGAISVVGIEALESHLQIAREVCRGRPVVRFQCQNLIDTMKVSDAGQFDIVLALGIAHKMPDPCDFMYWAARQCSGLLCFRAPAKKAMLEDGDYLIRGKHSKVACNVPVVMRKAGFRDEGIVWGARDEGVQYWRRM